MEKVDIRTQFGLEVRAARKSRNWNQSRLAKEINNQLPENYPLKFRQESISKLERGETTLQLTEDTVKKIQKILSIPDEVATPLIEIIKDTAGSKVTKHALFSVQESGQIIAKSSHQEFAAYFGEYFCYFFSTNSGDRKLIKGMLKIADNDGISTAYMTIYDDNNNEIKWYSGPFIINLHYRTWHCVLVGSEKQEVCMLTSLHFNSTLGPNLLSVALVLTTSSGTQKRPTMHRMLLSREAVPKSKQVLLQAQLRLNSDYITISEPALDRLQKETDRELQKAKGETVRKKHQAILACIKKIKELGNHKSVYTIDESIIYDSDTIVKDARLRSFVVSKIRSHSEAEYYNKISQTVQDICADIIKN